MKISEIISESKEIRTKKNSDGFTIDLIVDGKHVGQYTHAREDDIVRNQAEIFPEYRAKGYGTMLLLAAIKTADDLGLDFEEDTQSLTPAMSRIYDELDDSGMIYGGRGAWAISPSGESELEDFLNEDLRAWFGKGKKVYEAYEIEFVCVNPNFCDATDPKKQQALFNALKRVPGIIVYRQDFDVHNSMAAIIKDESDSVAPEKVQQLAKQHGVGIDLENDISQSMIDDIVTGRLEGLIDYYDTDLNEDLRAWFGKGKKGGAGGGGWDRYNTNGERIGKCGDSKEGEGKPKCLSKSRAASLRSSGGKKAIANAVKRKKTNDPNHNRKGKAKNVNNHPKK